MNTYHCHKVYVTETKAVQTGNTLDFFSMNFLMPCLSSKGMAMHCICNLIHALQHPAATLPLKTLEEQQMTALQALADIFSVTNPIPQQHQPQQAMSTAPRVLMQPVPTNSTNPPRVPVQPALTNSANPLRVPAQLTQQPCPAAPSGVPEPEEEPPVIIHPGAPAMDSLLDVDRRPYLIPRDEDLDFNNEDSDL